MFYFERMHVYNAFDELVGELAHSFVGKQLSIIMNELLQRATGQILHDQTKLVAFSNKILIFDDVVVAIQVHGKFELIMPFLHEIIIVVDIFRLLVHYLQMIEFYDLLDKDDAKAAAAHL